MIKIDPYTKEFEEEYWAAVKDKISEDKQKKIVKGCEKFLPDDFFEGTENRFKQLILAPFAKLKAAEKYITNNKMAEMKGQCFSGKGKRIQPYKSLHAAYKSVADSEKEGISLRVRMVQQTGLTVCPYCNRDYINCRSGNVAGAQLDHFYSRDKFPIFAVCLYNLVPVCGNCNRVKSAKPKEFVSPFDETVNWETAVVFTYEPKSKDGKVKVKHEEEHPIENNIVEMKIEQAYQIHDREVRELLDRQEAYSASQMDEFREVLDKVKLSDKEIKEIVFGPRISLNDMKTKPLGKMMHDLHKELGIYD